MFREMRRKDRALSEEEAGKILTEGEYGILSTIGEDGYPYGVPLSYAFDGNRILFHGAQEGLKLSNMEYSEKASFCVVGRTKPLPDKFSTVYESVIVFGRLRRSPDEQKLADLMQLIDKYSSDFREQGLKYAQSAVGKTEVYSLEIEHITGKARKK